MRYVAKLLKQSNKDQFASIWRENIKNVELRRKTFKTTQNYKSNQITMNCIDLMSKTSKKPTQNYKSDQISMNCIDLTSKRSKIWVTSQNYKSNQITMDCIDLTSKQSKMLSYVVKHSKLRKTTKEIKLQWIASIWHQNDLKCWDTSQNYKSDHIMMNLSRFDVKTITTTQNYESDQIIMYCINLTSKRSKKLSYVPKLQKWSNCKNCIDLMFKRSKIAELQKPIK